MESMELSLLLEEVVEGGSKSCPLQIGWSGGIYNNRKNNIVSFNT